MFTRRSALAVAVLAFASLATAAEGPALGESLDSQTVAAADFVVLPDGTGLPDGEGDALRGAGLYAQHCLACHGEGGTDGINDRLVGGHGSIDGDRPQKTVGSYWPYATTLFDYIRRAMPYQAPGSLSADEVYSLSAYILYLNDIVAEDERIDAATLPAIKMPNRENFEWAYTPQ